MKKQVLLLFLLFYLVSSVIAQTAVKGGTFPATKTIFPVSTSSTKSTSLPASASVTRQVGLDFSVTDTLPVTLTFKAKHHAFLTFFMPNRGGAEEHKYLEQWASKLILLNDSAKTVADTAQLIQVKTTYGLVKRMFLAIGSQQERLTTVFNEEIKASLLYQLTPRSGYAGYPSLLQDLGIIDQRNRNETNIAVNAGFDYAKAIRQ